jgi:hypothetical protein
MDEFYLISASCVNEVLVSSERRDLLRVFATDIEQGKVDGSVCVEVPANASDDHALLSPLDVAHRQRNVVAHEAEGPVRHKDSTRRRHVASLGRNFRSKSLSRFIHVLSACCKQS